MMIHCFGWMASMRAEHFLCFNNGGVWGEGLVPVKCVWAPPPPGGLGCCPFWGGGSVVVGFLFVVAPVVGVCGCSVFCCTLLCVHSGIAVVLMGRGGGWLLCLVCLPGVSWWLGGSSLRCCGVVCGL